MSEQLTSEQLDELAALYEAAVDLHWRRLKNKQVWNELDCWVCDTSEEMTAEFIAAAHNAFPQLLELARAGLRATELEALVSEADVYLLGSVLLTARQTMAHRNEWAEKVNALLPGTLPVADGEPESGEAGE